MLKAAQCAGAHGQALVVAYAIFGGNLCVFSATETTRDVGSSINFAEGIIEAIAEAEKLPVLKMRYFDLQTQSSYTSKLRDRSLPGEFELDEVALKICDGRVWAESWCPTRCPEHVVAQFKDFIGGSPRQILTHPPQEIKF